MEKLLAVKGLVDMVDENMSLQRFSQRSRRTRFVVSDIKQNSREKQSIWPNQWYLEEDKE